VITSAAIATSVDRLFRALLIEKLSRSVTTFLLSAMEPRYPRGTAECEDRCRIPAGGAVRL
jgi:hypothetical protein